MQYPTWTVAWIGSFKGIEVLNEIVFKYILITPDVNRYSQRVPFRLILLIIIIICERGSQHKIQRIFLLRKMKLSAIITVKRLPCAIKINRSKKNNNNNNTTIVSSGNLLICSQIDIWWRLPFYCWTDSLFQPPEIRKMTNALQFNIHLFSCLFYYSLSSIRNPHMCMWVPFDQFIYG